MYSLHFLVLDLLVLLYRLYTFFERMVRRFATHLPLDVMSTKFDLYERSVVSIHLVPS